MKHNLLITNRYRLVFIGTTLCNCNMLKPLFIISCSFLKLLVTRLSISYSFSQLLLFTFYNSHNILLFLRVNIKHHFLFFNLAMLQSYFTAKFITVGQSVLTHHKKICLKIVQKYHFLQEIEILLF